MSGGAYDYACFADAHNLMDGSKLEGLRRMADALSAKPETVVPAADTKRVLGIIDQTREQLTILCDRLSKVWQAQEWADSGDGGDPVEAVIEYLQPWNRCPKWLHDLPCPRCEFLGTVADSDGDEWDVWFCDQDGISNTLKMVPDPKHGVYHTTGDPEWITQEARASHPISHYRAAFVLYDKWVAAGKPGRCGYAQT